MIQKIILVGLGGGLGSVLRYVASLGIAKHWSGIFPLGTFLINLSGSLLIGLILGGLLKHQQIGEEWKLFLATGFCGGYTTFSTFSAENVSLLQSGQFTMALIYMVGSVLLGILAVMLGYFLISTWG